MSLEDRKLAPILLAPEVREANRQAEAARLGALMVKGAPPLACGPDIPVAPARGAMTAFRPIELVPGSVGLARDTGHWERGEDQRRRAGRLKDVFDRMADGAALRGEGEGHSAPSFTPGQVQVARDYRNLVERHAAGGVRCASLETAGRRSGGAGGEFIDAFVTEGRKLEAMQRRIGTGAAMRRLRPSKRGGAATGLITDRVLVDMVCLGDKHLGEVLSAHGWSVQTDALNTLRKALAAALDRMMGYDLHRTAK